jgi:Uma2 family endonuclease
LAIATTAPDRVFEVPEAVGRDDFLTVAEVLARHGVRITYLDGRLRLMCPSSRHVRWGWRLDHIITEAALALGLPIVATGDALFVGQAGLKGKMPDASYYLGDRALANHQLVGEQAIILPPLPAPDLAVEVIVGHEDPISRETYARLGVPEL